MNEWPVKDQKVEKVAPLQLVWGKYVPRYLGTMDLHTSIHPTVRTGPDAATFSSLYIKTELKILLASLLLSWKIAISDRSDRSDRSARP